MPRALLTLVLINAVWVFTPQSAQAITIDTVPVGNAGNAADAATGHGSVGYDYSIGKYEVTVSQYTSFLNAVAATDTYGLYDSRAENITQNGSSGSFSYSVRPGANNLPVTDVTWGDAARFANWLANGQPGLSGPAVPQNAASTEDGSYALNGAVDDASLNNVLREPTATVVIPSEDEWYKAAYYNPATASYFLYPTSSDTTPSNAFLDTGNNANFNSSGWTLGGPPFLTDVGHFSLSASPYGTFDQSGNAYEWNAALTAGSYRGLRGGSWSDIWSSQLSLVPGGSQPSFTNDSIGFRVAIVPEPGTAVLAGLSALLMWTQRARFKFRGD
jgi:formylglycine-generating enzyme required for sulfatase activity